MPRSRPTPGPATIRLADFTRPAKAAAEPTHADPGAGNPSSLAPPPASGLKPMTLEEIHRSDSLPNLETRLAVLDEYFTEVIGSIAQAIDEEIEALKTRIKALRRQRAASRERPRKRGAPRTTE